MLWVGRMIAFAVCLQSLELFCIPQLCTDLLELPAVARGLFKSYRFILGLRLLTAAVALISPSLPAVAFLLFATWYVGVSWRGTFNGGSDIMTFHILGAWSLSLAFPNVEHACLIYIAAQMVLSYFVAGLAKMVNPEWRSGVALATFLHRWGHPVSSRMSLAMTWGVLLFELLFPLALICPWPFVLAGILFHLVNAYVFGLNRFFFVWLAGYPALLAIAQR